MTPASGEIQCVARLKIFPGKMEEYKKFSRMCDEIVRTKDKGTLQYESYFNAERNECLVFERYKDEASMMNHFENIGDLMGEILKTCSGHGEICGAVSEKLIKELEGGPVAVYLPLKKT